MSFDLHRDLPDLGSYARATVPDLPTEDLVHQLRRRRAVRTSVRAGAALAVVGGLVAGGVAVAGMRRPEPAPARTPDFSSCGQTLEELGWEQDGPIVNVAAGVSLVEGDGHIQVAYWPGSFGPSQEEPGPHVATGGLEPTAAAVRDGVVVGVLVQDGTMPEVGLRGTLMSCDDPGASLEPGAYTLITTEDLTYADTAEDSAAGRTTPGRVVSEELILIAAPIGAQDAAGRDAVWGYGLPGCGEPFSAPGAAAAPGPTLRFATDLPTAVAGADVPTALVQLSMSTDDESADLTPEVLWGYALVRDGTVVGRSTAIVSEPKPLAATGPRGFVGRLASLCRPTDGSERGTLPAGDYELWATASFADGPAGWALAGPWAFTVGDGGPTLAGAGVPGEIPLVVDVLLGVDGAGPDGPWRVEAELGMGGLDEAVAAFDAAGWTATVPDPTPEAVGRHRLVYTDGTWQVVIEMNGNPYYGVTGTYQISRA